MMKNSILFSGELMYRWQGIGVVGGRIMLTGVKLVKSFRLFGLPTTKRFSMGVKKDQFLMSGR